MSKEIKDRFRVIVRLLEEIEDILRKPDDDNDDDGQQVSYRSSSVCICGRYSIGEMSSVGRRSDDRVRKYRENDGNIATRRQFSGTRVEFDGLEGESSESSRFSRKNAGKRSEKNPFDDLWDDVRDPRTDDGHRTLFKSKLNDIRQKFMNCFDNVNGN